MRTEFLCISVLRIASGPRVLCCFVWICPFPLPLGVWEGLRFVIVALPGRFSYLFLFYEAICFMSYLDFSLTFFYLVLFCFCVFQSCPTCSQFKELIP